MTEENESKSYKENLTESMLAATYDGGVLSLSALEKNLKEIANKSGGDTKLSINEFICIVGIFKQNIARCASEQISEQH